MQISGGPTEVLVDWGHRTTLILSPAFSAIFSVTCPFINNNGTFSGFRGI